jgi:cytochrome c oxidase cbb3-type subunit I/II
VPVIRAPALTKGYVEPEQAPVAGGLLARFNSLRFHRDWERMPLVFTVLVIVAVAVASLFEIIPTFLIKSNVPTIASVHPYSPLELAGRDLYIREGCFNCHSQMVRPFRFETERYGEYSKPGESVYDHPFLWGSRRLGPDLAREGGKYNDAWHLRHLQNPRAISPKSIMPSYAEMTTRTLDFDQIQHRVDVMAMLGVPYGDAVTRAAQMARDEARSIAATLEQQGAQPGLQDKEVVAMIAYLQRLGRDIKAVPNVAASPNATRVAPSAAAGSHP